MTEEEQARFNFAMLRLTGRTIRQCFYEAHGFWPHTGPKLQMIRTAITLTEKYGTPSRESEVIAMVRKVCHEHGLTPLGRN